MSIAKRIKRNKDEFGNGIEKRKTGSQRACDHVKPWEKTFSMRNSHPLWIQSVM